METIERCENCIWWADYNDSVRARISNTVGGPYPRGDIELKACKFSPPPAHSEVNKIYVDADFCCSGFSHKKKQEIDGS